MLSISPMMRPYKPILNRLNTKIIRVFISTPTVVDLNASLVSPRACRVLASGPSKLYKMKKKRIWRTKNG